MLNIIFPSLSWVFKLKQTVNDFSSILSILPWIPCFSLATWNKRMYPHVRGWVSNGCSICNKFRNKTTMLKSFWPCSGKALAADGRADFRLDWKLCWECGPQQSSGQKSVKPRMIRDNCITQKHFWICKERTFRPLDHQEGSLLNSDVVQSHENFSNGAL